jgi:ribosome-binding protein aMBF1 (putative translation factor)
MTDRKLTKKEVEALEAQIKADQEKPVRENERRLRIGDDFKDAVKKMAKTPPISNKDLAEWARKQKKDIE